MSSVPTLYPAFNARTASARQVGLGFVEPPQFGDVCQPNHTLLLGPRGSGKTTLLKMLQPEALKAWKHGEVARELFQLPFRAVYVPSDVTWVKQLVDVDAYERAASRSVAITRAAVSAAVLDAFLERCSYDILDERQAGPLNTAIEELSAAWELGPPYPSLDGMRQLLAVRLMEIGTETTRLELALRDNRPLDTPLPSYFNHRMLDALRAGLAVLTPFLREGPHLWAICFDELEIMPVWLRTELLALLRSADQRFVFKLSGSPFEEALAVVAEEERSQERQDFDVVPLTYARVDDSRKFSLQVATRLVTEKLKRPTLPERVFDDPRPAAFRGRHAYDSGAPFWKHLKAEAAANSRLRTKLQKLNIDPSVPRILSDRERNQFARKLEPILRLRAEYTRRQRGKGASVRSRKVTSYFSGIPELLHVADGNPRALIGMLREMLEGIADERVSVEVQASVIYRTSKRFEALVEFMPQARANINEQTLSLYALVNRIGHYYQQQFLKGEVLLDPTGSFVLDREAGPALIQLVRLGLSVGCFVHADSKGASAAALPLGRRFRLNHLLAPVYRLPLRLYDPVQLSEIIGKGLRVRRAGHVVDLAQEDLFA